MRRVYKNLALGLLTASGVAAYLPSAQADPRPCRFGYKGVYVTWAKDSSSAGTGTFQTDNGRAAVLPNFTWEVTGTPLSVKIATDEPFQGGNSMKGFYGQADDANNINIRIEANDVSPRSPIPHSAFLTLKFNGNTPASGWGFAVVDIDVDQVRFSAKDANGSSIATSEIARWFVQDFDASFLHSRNGFRTLDEEQQPVVELCLQALSAKEPLPDVQLSVCLPRLTMIIPWFVQPRCAPLPRKPLKERSSTH